MKPNFMMESKVKELRSLGVKEFLFLIFFLTFTYAYAREEKLGLDFKISAPPAAEFVESKPVTIFRRELQMEAYKSRQNLEAVKTHYQNFFKEKGFTPADFTVPAVEGVSVSRFKKEPLSVDIYFIVKPEGIEVTVAKYLQEPGEPDLEKTKFSVKDPLFKLPSEDVSGEDLLIIPRPPDSVRWMAQELNQGASLMYATSLTVAQAREFYLSKMPYQGWELSGEIDSGKAIGSYEKQTKKELKINTPLADAEDFNEIFRAGRVLSFNGRFGRAEISLMPNFMDKKLGAIVQVEYSEN